jgi:hypothetical protein
LSHLTTLSSVFFPLHLKGSSKVIKRIKCYNVYERLSSVLAQSLANESPTFPSNLAALSGITILQIRKVGLGRLRCTVDKQGSLFKLSSSKANHQAFFGLFLCLYF